LPRWRRLGGPAGRIMGLALALLAGTGALPRLVSVQALVTALLTMVLGAAAVVDVDGSVGWHRLLRRVARPARGFVLFGLATFLIQMPPAVTEVSRGGLPALLTLVPLMLVAMVFWTSVVAPEPALLGLAAGGYVVLGGIPIGVPPLLLVMLPRDIYTQLHHLYPPPFAAVADQRAAGFVLLATVKIAILTAFSAIFFSAAAESEAGGRDEGGHGVPPLPALPGWAVGLGPDSPAALEPEAAAAEVLPG
jgi:cytochrome c oxidase assembly factor CtaG